mmetsp:Transcript_8958/g.25778  ORF Transcript_8958/g.25778 Transcript_8958/m.25778 type:complete len:204 (+) Transcript_8958:432-1043(+)
MDVFSRPCVPAWLIRFESRGKNTFSIRGSFPDVPELCTGPLLFRTGKGAGMSRIREDGTASMSSWSASSSSSSSDRSDPWDATDAAVRSVAAMLRCLAGPIDALVFGETMAFNSSAIISLSFRPAFGSAMRISDPRVIQVVSSRIFHSSFPKSPTLAPSRCQMVTFLSEELDITNGSFVPNHARSVTEPLCACQHACSLIAWS